MKKFFAIILIFAAVILPAYADGSKGKGTSQPIKLETEPKPRPTTGQHRSPLLIDIEAYYDYENGTIDINYNGDCDGVAYLYLNGAVVDYSPEINTSFTITVSGMYKIEIIAENWASTGYLQL